MSAAAVDGDQPRLSIVDVTAPEPRPYHGAAAGLRRQGAPATAAAEARPDGTCGLKAEHEEPRLPGGDSEVSRPLGTMLMAGGGGGKGAP